MAHPRFTHQRLIIGSMLGLYVLVAFFGVVSCWLMPPASDYAMSDMALVDCMSAAGPAAALCPLLLSAQIRHTIMTATVVFPLQWLSFIVIVIGGLALALLLDQRRHLKRLADILRTYLVQHREYRLNNLQLRLFAQGILQPKLYA